MIPYKWIESDEQYIAVIKPEELFLENSVYEKSRSKFRTSWNGIIKQSGEEETYAFGYLKQWCSKQQAERMVLHINDAFIWHQEEEITNKVD
ncbi:MAG: hypothetical protein LWY06_17395 [Firmicutes bacterium]|nr:hypothetical protein [Bacillota bacterium]